MHLNVDHINDHKKEKVENIFDKFMFKIFITFQCLVVYCFHPTAVWLGQVAGESCWDCTSETSRYRTCILIADIGRAGDDLDLAL